MRELFRTLPLMCLVLLVPVLPFIFFGGHFESWLRGITEDPPSRAMSFALVVGLLSTDILLPIPSSVISTLSGWQLGWWLGGLATWLGMNLGAVIGFAVARRWGRSVASWFSSSQDLDAMQRVSAQFGPLVLVLTRAMPVFAEASVLIAGIHQLSWGQFLPAILLSNLGIAAAYAWFGDFAEQHEWLPFALAIAVAVPILVAAVAKRLLLSEEKRSESS